MTTESYVTLDRIEENEGVVIFEDRQWDLPMAWLPENTKEGDVLRIVIEMDESQSRSERERIQSKRDALEKRSPESGNFDL